MKREMQIKVAIVEDSKFYNLLLTRQLENYIHEIAKDKSFHFDIQTYTNSYDFLQNMKDDLDVAFIDYYLGDNVTGIDILKKIKAINKNCKVIIVSRAENIKTSLLSTLEGASDFVLKDKNAFSKICLIVEDIINSKLEGKNA